MEQREQQERRQERGNVLIEAVHCASPKDIVFAMDVVFGVHSV